MISHCGFGLHFSNNCQCWVFFMCPLTICLSSLEKYLFRFFVHLKFFFILSCMSYLYILDINLLLAISFSNISPI